MFVYHFRLRKGLTAAAAVQDIADLPLHPGAQRYYEEIGVI